MKNISSCFYFTVCTGKKYHTWLVGNVLTVPVFKKKILNSKSIGHKSSVGVRDLDKLISNHVSRVRKRQRVQH